VSFGVYILERERDRERQRECVCACVCVCVEMNTLFERPKQKKRRNYQRPYEPIDTIFYHSTPHTLNCSTFAIVVAFLRTVL
jgi:hypothetical protein